MVWKELHQICRSFIKLLSTKTCSSARVRSCIPILNFMASTFLNSLDCTDHIAEGGKKDAAHDM